MQLSERIEKIIKILSEKYNSSDKTTLNRMRLDKNPDAPFKILISCLLSLRTQDKNTEKVSEQLFRIAKTPQEILALPIKKLEKIIFSSGHYKKKARTLQHVSQELLKRFDGKVPKTKKDLLSIKGVGPKTANIVLAFAYKKPVIPVDVHVHIITNRLGWVKTKNPEKTEIELMKIVPREYWKEFNAIFVQFGKEICITLSPKCSICSIRKLCPRIGVIRSR